MVVVWSEVRTPPPYTQCSECGYLMGLLYAGFGVPQPYSQIERDAFTDTEVDRGYARAHNQPAFPLIDAASLKRYGVRLRAISNTRASQTQLKAALSAPNRGVVLPGSYAGLPKGHFLRRHQPNYIGGHMVFVVNEGGTKLRWLDPLAPTGYAGDVTDVATALKFAWIPTDAHEVFPDEFKGRLPDTAMEDDSMPEVKQRLSGQRFLVHAGSKVFTEPRFGAPVAYGVANDSQVSDPYAIVVGDSYKDPPGNTAGTTNNGWVAFIRGDKPAYGYIPLVNGELKPQPPTGSAQLTAVRAALTQAQTAITGEEQAHQAADTAHDAAVEALKRAIVAAQ